MIRLPGRPSQGFGLAKQADVPAMNDPYRSYETTVMDQDEIWNALTTEGGRQALGAQIK